MKWLRSTYLATLFWSLATLLVGRAVADPVMSPSEAVFVRQSAPLPSIISKMKANRSGMTASPASYESDAPNVAPSPVDVPFHRFSPLYMPPGFVPDKHIPDYRRLIKILPHLLRKTRLDQMLLEEKVDSLALALSIIRTESEFKQRAVSHKGAKGFWQIKLVSAREVHAKHRRLFDPNLEAITEQNIFHLRVNNLAGILYFKQMLRHPWNRERSIEWAVMAYNAGARNIENGDIPAVTRAYLRGIRANYRQIMDYNRDLRAGRARPNRRTSPARS